jgi:DNA-binding CsgD family transcriptional regulator
MMATMALENSNAVRFGELQHALRLALELRDLPTGSELQKRRALEGLASLVEAQVGQWVYWVYVDDSDHEGGGTTLRRALDLGWPHDADQGAFVAYIDSEQSMSGPIGTFVRDSVLYTIYAPPDRGMVVGFSLHRPWGGQPFSERERRLVDVFHRECVFLHEPPSDLPPTILRGLAPRLRETLLGLVRGRSEKQLAADAGLSPHTVHDYVKALHRHFGVQSRSELLARCLAVR